MLSPPFSVEEYIRRYNKSCDARPYNKSWYARQYSKSWHAQWLAILPPDLRTKLAINDNTHGTTERGWTTPWKHCGWRRCVVAMQHFSDFETPFVCSREEVDYKTCLAELID